MDGGRTASFARQISPSAAWSTFQQMVAQCVEQKVSRIIRCDTTGGANRRRSRSSSRDSARASRGMFGFHVTPIADLESPTRGRNFWRAVQVQGTILGTGERCGNVNLTTVIGAMQLRDERSLCLRNRLRG